MKTLIITVAGLSSRFSKSVGRDTLKCIYSEGDFSECLLSRLLRLDDSFDRYIIVGGFKYAELVSACEKELAAYGERLVLVENTHFSDYGSGYSLKLGLAEAIRLGSDEIVFAEGDLSVDSASFKKVSDSRISVLTSNTEAILANKAVAYYFDTNYGIHYIYDTGHTALEIREPFLAIYNSGQIWKFTGKDRIQAAFDNVTDEAWQGTNLVYIQAYFGALSKDDYEVVPFERWVNCNTVEDYRKTI